MNPALLKWCILRVFGTNHACKFVIPASRFNAEILPWVTIFDIRLIHRASGVGFVHPD